MLEGEVFGQCMCGLYVLVGQQQVGLFVEGQLQCECWGGQLCGMLQDFVQCGGEGVVGDCVWCGVVVGFLCLFVGEQLQDYVDQVFMMDLVYLLLVIVYWVIEFYLEWWQYFFQCFVFVFEYDVGLQYVGVYF